MIYVHLRPVTIKTLALTILLMAMGYVGLNTFLRQGYAFRFPPHIRALLNPINAQTDRFYEIQSQIPCRLIDKPHAPYQVTCIEQKRPLAILWGDSHAQSLIAGLLNLQKQFSFGLMSLTAAQCPPVLNVKPYLFREECDAYAQYDIDLIGKLRPELLIIASTYREPRYFWERAYFEERFSNTLKEIARRSPNTKVIIFGPTPRWGISPQTSFFTSWRKAHDKNGVSVWQKARRVDQYDELLTRQAKVHSYQFVSLWNVFCQNQMCLTRVRDSATDFISFDYGHLSQAGSIYALNQVSNLILNDLGIARAK